MASHNNLILLIYAHIYVYIYIYIYMTSRRNKIAVTRPDRKVGLVCRPVRKKLTTKKDVPLRAHVLQ